MMDLKSEEDYYRGSNEIAYSMEEVYQQFCNYELDSLTWDHIIDILLRVTPNVRNKVTL